MKLEMTLPTTPTFLHALPLLDMLALVMLFPVLTTALAPQAGVEVELPETEFRLQRISRPIVVSISGGTQPEYWIGKQKVKRDEVMARVAENAANWSEGGKPAVLLKVDKSAQDIGVDLSFEILRAGYRCMWGAKLAQ